MKIVEVKPLAIPEVKVVRFARFPDHRGYFTETWRRSDFQSHPSLSFLHDVQFGQANESFSRPRTIRGLHFQWNPYMGKLVRTIMGRMVDLVLDIRLGSPTFGKIIAHDIPSRPDMDYAEWIWVPPGFAHGNFFTVETAIEYYCSGQYNPACEAGISPLSPDLDWSLCDPALRALFRDVADHGPLLSDKDRDGLSVEGWRRDERAQQFRYGT